MCKVCRGKALTYVEEGKINAKKRSSTLNRIAESAEEVILMDKLRFVAIVQAQDMVIQK